MSRAIASCAREYEIEGIPTIIPFHRLMLSDERFVESTHTTKYLDEELDESRIADAQEQWGTDAESADGDDEETVEREFTVEVNGKRFEVELEERGAPAIPTGDVDTGNAAGPPQPAGGSQDESTTDVAGSGETVDAEMQGTILDIEVEEGNEVAAGDVLVVLEAMKMENDIVASTGGTVSQIAVAEGIASTWERRSSSSSETTRSGPSETTRVGKTTALVRSNTQIARRVGVFGGHT